MKQTIMIFLVGIFLAGCTQMVPTIQDQRTRVSCTDEHYYDQLIIDKYMDWNRDDNQSAYILDIPEWCMRVIASAPIIDDFSGDVVAEWKEFIQPDVQKGVRIRNNMLNAITNDFISANHIVVNNKKISQTIDEAIQDQFTIRSHLTDKYCEIKPFSGNWYYLNRRFEMMTYEEIEQNIGLLNSQTCGNDFPMQNVGFEHLIPSLIWYDEQLANRYVLYKSDQSHDPMASLWTNVSFEFYQ